LEARSPPGRRGYRRAAVAYFAGRDRTKASAASTGSRLRVVTESRWPCAHHLFPAPET